MELVFKCVWKELFEIKNDAMLMKLLELFSGTGSVGRVARQLGIEVISLDKDMEADIKTDIMNWNYRTFQPGHFDIIWASPPCTEYSIALTTRPRKIEEANKVVKRTLEIIDYLRPNYFMIENPQTGYLKKQTFMEDLPYGDIDYCKYGMLYRKRTRIWNNIVSWEARPLCLKDCGNMDNTGRKHKATAQRMPSGKKATWGEQPLFRQDELYRIPAELINELLTTILNNT